MNKKRLLAIAAAIGLVGSLVLAAAGGLLQPVHANVASTNTPTYTPTPTSTPWQLWLPLVLKNYPSKRGIALAADGNWPDLDALNAGWFQVWAMTTGVPPEETQAEFIPLTLNGSIPSPCTEGPLLVYNEPDIVPGSPTPAQAASQVIAIEASCTPTTTLIVGNVAFFSGSWPQGGWLQQFLWEYQAAHPQGAQYSQALGGHCYSWNTADQCVATFADYAGLGRPLWITEMNVFNPQAGEFLELLQAACQTAVRFAVFANRHTSGDPWVDRDYTLVNPDGSLKPQGIEFRDFDC